MKNVYCSFPTVLVGCVYMHSISWTDYKSVLRADRRLCFSITEPVVREDVMLKHNLRIVVVVVVGPAVPTGILETLATTIAFRHARNHGLHGCEGPLAGAAGPTGFPLCPHQVDYQHPFILGHPRRESARLAESGTLCAPFGLYRQTRRWRDVWDRRLRRFGRGGGFPHFGAPPLGVPRV